MLLTSSSVILFGFGSGLDIIKSQHSSKPDALAGIGARCATACAYPAVVSRAGAAGKATGTQKITRQKKEGQKIDRWGEPCAKAVKLV